MLDMPGATHSMKASRVASFTGHSERVWSVDVNAASTRIASCSSDQTIRIWPVPKAPTASFVHPIATMDEAHRRTIRCVRFSTNDKLLASAGFDGTTAIWEPSSTEPGDPLEFECVATLEGHENEVKCVAWSASGQLVATCGRDKSVWIWEVIGDSDFECMSVLQEHSQDVKCVVWHPYSDILASASYDDTIKIYKDDEDDWYCADTLEGHTSTVWAIDFDATGNYLASVSEDKSLKVWKARTLDPEERTWRQESKWECIGTMSDLHSRSIYSVSWSKEHGLIATAGGDNCIRIVRPQMFEDSVHFELLVEVPSAHGEVDVNCVQWMKPGSSTPYMLVSGGDDGQVHLWNTSQA